MNEQNEQKDVDQEHINWNEHAEYWDDFKDARLYTEHTYSLLKERINLKNLNILDFGCGTGILTEYMAREAKEIVALDSSEKMIEVLVAKNLKNVKSIASELSKESIQKYPVLNKKFDLIVASSVCAFVPNLTEVLSIIKSLLKPGGIFVQWDWLKTEQEADFGFTEDMIRKYYAEAGLTVDQMEIPFHFIENEEKMEVIMAVGKK